MAPRLVFAALACMAQAIACDPISHTRAEVAVPTQHGSAARGHRAYVQAFRFPVLDGGMPVSAYGARVLTSSVYAGDPIVFEWQDVGRHDWALLAWIDLDDSSASSPPTEARPSKGDLYWKSEVMTSPRMPAQMRIELAQVWSGP